MSSALVTLFGDSLKKGSSTFETQSIDAEVIGIYFSAHWCPPCRQFTPVLAASYNKIRESGKKFEIIFVSSDHDQDSFDEYFNEHPWAAVPFVDRARKEMLSKKYKVKGIPTLVLLGPDGKIINADGRSAVMADPDGDDFPWAKKTFSEVIGDNFLGPDGNEVSKAAIADKVVAIYFSAHWCPPCRSFTPELIKTYNKVKAAGHNFEIIFASSDRSEEAFEEYFDEMPWLSIPYADRKRKEALSSMFGVDGIPMLVIVDTDGTTITTAGRTALGQDPEGAEFPWLPKPVKDIEAGPDGLNDLPCVIALMEKAEASVQATVEEALTGVGVEHQALRKETNDEEGCLFFTAKRGGSVVDQIRMLCKMGVAEDGASQLILLDIPDNGGFYVSDHSGEINDAVVRAFVDGYRNKTLTRRQLES